MYACQVGGDVWGRMIEGRLVLCISIQSEEAWVRGKGDSWMVLAEKAPGIPDPAILL